MTDSPLLNALRRALRLARQAERQGLSTDAVISRATERAWSRRQTLLRGSAGLGALGVLALTPGLLSACGSEDSGSGTDGGPGGSGSGGGPAGGGTGGGGGSVDLGPPVVGVVGAGLAGLTCAMRLKQAGISARVYEASSRAGGRVETARDAFTDGVHAELGGAFISAGHARIRALVSELDLSLVDLAAALPQGASAEAWYFGGRHVRISELVDLFRPLAGKMQGSLLTAYLDGIDAPPDPNEFGRLDAMSIAEYLEREIQADRLMTSVLDAAYVSELGLDLGDQSAWNLLSLIDSETADPFRVFGVQDQGSTVSGGNDRLIEALVSGLSESVQTEHRLVGASRTADGRTTLRFDQGGTPVEATYDQVVLALPFTQLRKLLDQGLSDLIEPDALSMIRELGYGTHTRTLLGFRSRVWATEHFKGGAVFTDTGSQRFWDAALGQPSLLGVLANTAGGTLGAARGQGDLDAAALVEEVEGIYPGARTLYFPDSALRKDWGRAPNLEGSVSCYRPGQAVFGLTTPQGAAGVYLAGEHLSRGARGSMEGAVETGESAARAVAAARA